MIKYVIRAKKNPQNKEVKYYPQAAPVEAITLKEIIGRIEKTSTVSSADCKAVLDALQYEVIAALKDGKSVRLGDLGSFRLTISSEGVATVEEAKKKGTSLIKAVKVQFHKSVAMDEALQKKSLSFSYLESVSDSAAAVPETPAT